MEKLIFDSLDNFLNKVVISSLPKLLRRRGSMKQEPTQFSIAQFSSYEMSSNGVGFEDLISLQMTWKKESRICLSGLYLIFKFGETSKDRNKFK